MAVAGAEFWVASASNPRRAFRWTLVASITVSRPRRKRLAAISRSSWNASAEALWSAFVVGNRGAQGVRRNNLRALEMLAREGRFAASRRADQEHQSALGMVSVTFAV